MQLFLIRSIRILAVILSFIVLLPFIAYPDDGDLIWTKDRGFSNRNDILLKDNNGGFF